MKKQRASVTFFMSIVYLTLISFGFGLVEAYRVQYLYAKQTEIGAMAVHNLKAEYIRDILEEYGLLLYKDSLANKEILEKTAKFAMSKKPDAKYFQDLFIENGSEKYYHFPYFQEKSLTAKKVNQKIELADLLSMKKEALLFAKDRVVFTAFESLLEKLEVWKKSTTAEEWLKKKEDIIKEINVNDKKVKRLYLYLDGVKIKEKTHQVEVVAQGINHLNANESKRLEKEELIRRLDDMPSELKEDSIKRQVEIKEWINKAQEYYEDTIAKIEPQPVPEEDPEGNHEYTPPESMSPEEGTESTVDSDSMQEDLQDYLNKYNNAIDTSAQILKAYEDAIPKIKAFIEEIKDTDISRNIKSSLIHEMETVLENCDMENSLTRSGNFKYIHEKLGEERDAFRQTMSNVKSYWREADNLIREYRKTLKNEKLEWKEERVSDWYEKGKKIVEQASFSYFYLKYNGYQVKADGISEDELEKREESLNQESEKAIQNSFDEKEGADEMGDDLPSKHYAPESTKSFDVSGSMIETALAKLKNLGEGVMLDEYYFMVFSHFALSEKEELALSGYAKTDHAKKGEIEYLLFGGSETANRLAMISSLFAARILFNVISLMSDPQKMATVQSMAATIAGWWSLGIGIAALSAIIIGIWSSLETSADIFMLFRGKRVPIIKTPSAWYTSLSGGLSELATEGVDSIADNTEKLLEKALDGFQDQIEEISGDFTTDLRYELENEVGEALDNAQFEIEYAKEQVELAIKEGLKDSFDNYGDAKEKTREKLLAIGLAEEQADQIIENTFGKVEEKIDDQVKKNYTEKIDFVMEKLEKGKESVDNWVKEKEINAHTALKKKLSELNTELKKKGKDFIKKNKKLIKEKISAKLKKVETPKPQSPTPEKNKIDLREYLGLSYVDYLRIFLLIKEGDQDLKWLRALDLVQFNKQKTMPAFYISDCERRFQIDVEGQYKPTFTPFGEKGLFTEWLESVYYIKSSVKGGY